MNESDLLRRADANQRWWEGLRGGGPSHFVRAEGNDRRLRLFAFTCGWLSSDLSMMLSRGSGYVRFPVPAYLIDHPRGRVLFDTGMHPECQRDAPGRMGGLGKLFHVHYQPGEEITSRLAAMGIEPDSISHVVNSHLHFDHSGGNALFPNARIVVQRREWEAGRIPELMEANAFNPEDYDLGHLVMQVDGAHDLFGDGTIVTIPTFGHTPGHQSLKLRIASREIVLAADACYFKQSLEEMHLPKLCFDRSKMIDSIMLLRRMRSQGARIFYGHDPDFWKSVPQAPAVVL